MGDGEMNITRTIFAGLIGCLSWTCMAAQPAQAQFVCVGNSTGATVPTLSTADGAGATAAGNGDNVACGTSATAAGTVSSNTAIGIAANASGSGIIVD